MVGNNHIVTACYDNAGHMVSNQIFLVLMIGSKNILTNAAYYKIYVMKIAHKQMKVRASFVSQEHGTSDADSHMFVKQ